MTKTNKQHNEQIEANMDEAMSALRQAMAYTAGYNEDGIIDMSEYNRSQIASDYMRIAWRKMAQTRTAAAEAKGEAE